MTNTTAQTKIRDDYVARLNDATRQVVEAAYKKSGALAKKMGDEGAEIVSMAEMRAGAGFFVAATRVMCALLRYSSDKEEYDRGLNNLVAAVKMELTIANGENTFPAPDCGHPQCLAKFAEVNQNIMDITVGAFENMIRNIALVTGEMQQAETEHEA